LLLLLESGKFEMNISVPLVLEYEDAAKRLIEAITLSESEIDDVLDYLCAVAHHREIYYLWRPFLKDPKDDMVLELAVVSQCGYIVTYNKRDYLGVEEFGIQVLTPQEFLREIGELP